MPAEPAPAAGWSHAIGRHATLVLVAILVVCSLPDLLSPPVSPTGLRQAQTFQQTVNLAAAGFSLDGLTMYIEGHRPVHVVHEFPIYQGLCGLIFLALGPSFFLGKLVSLVATVGGFCLALQLARHAWGDRLAFRAALFFATCPITLLVDASFQPDALALALGAVAAWAQKRWHEQPGLARWGLFLLILLAASLAKFTVLVPFVPLVVATILYRDNRLRPPSLVEAMSALLLFVAPFVLWNLHRSTLIDPRYLGSEQSMFLLGDLRRFLQPGYYVKPAFILGAMAMCGTGVLLGLAGLLRMDRPTRLLVWGVPLYFVLIPTAAVQTYYAWPLVPILAVLMGRGGVWFEQAVAESRRWMPRLAIGLLWAGGFAIAAPYTLRHDEVTMMAAQAARETSGETDLLFVMNMHDRGVAIGSFNPLLLTLAERRGWNVEFDSTNRAALHTQIELRRRDGARWLVATWFTPDLDPWFTFLLPPSFSRQPRHAGQPVNGEAIVQALQLVYPATHHGRNFAILDLDSPTR